MFSHHTSWLNQNRSSNQATPKKMHPHNDAFSFNLPLVDSPEQLTPKGYWDLPEDTFCTSRFTPIPSDTFSPSPASSQFSDSTPKSFSTEPSSIFESNELPPIPDDAELRYPYSLYLQRLSNEDLEQRKQNYDKRVHNLLSQVAFQPNEALEKTVQKIRQYQAEQELAQDELLFRNKPMTIDECLDLNQHRISCEELIDQTWKPEDALQKMNKECQAYNLPIISGEKPEDVLQKLNRKRKACKLPIYTWEKLVQNTPPRLNKATIEFLTQPHQNGYFRYIQEHSDKALNQRVEMYEKVREASKEQFKEALHDAKNPRGELSIQDGGLVQPICSLLATDKMQKLKDLGRYQAEYQLAKIELDRRGINRGEYDIPTNEFTINAMVNPIYEYLLDVYNEFKQPDEDTVGR